MSQKADHGVIFCPDNKIGKIKYMSDISFHMPFKRPKYPVIIISSNALFPAFALPQLKGKCLKAESKNGEEYIKSIDSNGTEFWYSIEHGVVTPGFFVKKWSKKRIIELFNANLDQKHESYQYSTKSLSAKHLDRVAGDICALLKDMLALSRADVSKLEELL